MNRSNVMNYKWLEFNKLDWQAILPRFGISADLILNPKKLGPCPIEGEGKTRFRFENKNGRGNWHCNNCGHGDAIKLIALVNGCSDIDAIRMIRDSDGVAELPIRKTKTYLEKSPKDISKIRRSLQRVWDASKPIIEGDPVALYLHRRIPKLDLKWISSSLRFNPKLYHFDIEQNKQSVFPAIVSRVIGIDGIPVTLHRTYLSNDGFKAPVTPDQVKKQMTGVSTLSGDCIHLNNPIIQSRILYVAEGIETGLAIVAKQKNQNEVWSALNAGNLSKLKVPSERFDHVVLMADNDCLNQMHGWRPGEHYAEIARAKLESDGFKVTIKIPKKEGTDFLDRWIDICKANHFVA